MPDGKNKHSFGYTIIEVMIVLAVSGLMFIIAATFINGKQQTVAFTTGVNEMATQLQALIEQVSDGQYSDIPLTCLFANGSTTIEAPTSTSSQGTNANCVFLGKMIYFSSLPTTKYQVLALAGGRIDSYGNPITDPNSAGATYVSPYLNISQAVPENIQVVDVSVPDSAQGATNTPLAIGFLQSQGSAGPAGSGTILNGSQTINMYYDSNTDNLSNNQGSSDDTYDSSIPALVQTNSIDLCMTNGTRYADIQMGVSNSEYSSNPLNVTVKMDGLTSCVTQ